MSVVKAVKPVTERAAAAKLARQARETEIKARKLHAIATRRAEEHGLSKLEFIAQIVKGKYRPITPEDIANEPDPQKIQAAPAPAEPQEAQEPQQPSAA